MTPAPNSNYFTVDREFDVDVWRRFGRAVQNSTLYKLCMAKLLRADFVNEGILAAAVRGIHTFFAEVKHSTSIVCLNLYWATETLLDDLSQFIENNKALKRLILIDGNWISLEQSAALSRAIGSAELKHLQFKHPTPFRHNESSDMILEGCIRVHELSVHCERNSQCNTVAALLRDPANMVRELSVSLILGFYSHDEDWRSFTEQAFRDMATSLVGNTCLQRLNMSFCRGKCELDGVDNIEKLLCDVSNIESIRSNSNHTFAHFALENITFSGFDYKPSTLAEQCLQLNMNENKAKVERNKIFQFYFVGEFDVSLFVNMPLSVLPKVMGQIEGKDKQSAVYRLLKWIPELCYVCYRVSSDQHDGNMRLKASFVHNNSNSV